MRSHKIFWHLTRISEISQDLLRSHKIFFDLIKSNNLFDIYIEILYLTYDIWHLIFDFCQDMVLQGDIDTISIHSLMDFVVISAIWVWLVGRSVGRNLDLRDASASKNITSKINKQTDGRTDKQTNKQTIKQQTSEFVWR